MKRFKIFTVLAFTACALSACGEKEPLTPQQTAVAKKLEDAPPKSVVVFSSNKSNVSWGLICPTRFEDRIMTTSISVLETWTCESSRSRRHSQKAAVLARWVEDVITPDDPEYKNKIADLMLKMLVKDK